MLELVREEGNERISVCLIEHLCPQIWKEMVIEFYRYNELLIGFYWIA